MEFSSFWFTFSLLLPPGFLVEVYFYIMDLHYSHLPFPKTKSWPFALMPLCCSMDKGEVVLPFQSVCGEFSWLMVSKMDFTILLPPVPDFLLSTGPHCWDKALNLPARGRKQVAETYLSLEASSCPVDSKWGFGHHSITSSHSCHALLWWAEGLVQQHENWHNRVWFQGFHVAEFTDKAAWIWLKL